MQGDSCGKLNTLRRSDGSEVNHFPYPWMCVFSMVSTVFLQCIVQADLMIAVAGSYLLSHRLTVSLTNVFAAVQVSMFPLAPTMRRWFGTTSRDSSAFSGDS